MGMYNPARKNCSRMSVIRAVRFESAPHVDSWEVVFTPPFPCGDTLVSIVVAFETEELTAMVELKSSLDRREHRRLFTNIHRLKIGCSKSTGQSNQ